MTFKDNVQAVLESSFAGMKDEIINRATENIVNLAKAEKIVMVGKWKIYDEQLLYNCDMCGYVIGSELTGHSSNSFGSVLA